MRTKTRGVGRLVLFATLGVTAAACGDEMTAPGSRGLHVSTGSAALIGDPDPAMVSTLLDSFSIGGVYTVLPTGGYGGGTTYSTRVGYAETISRHPTGIVLPAGLPVRLLAEGVVVSTATPAFFSTWCPGTPDQAALCDAESISYSVQGLVPGPGVGFPYQEGTGLKLQWRRLAPFAEQYGSADPTEAQLFRGVVPGGDTIATSELHFRRSGCCYFLGASGESLEQYAGSWRFGAVPDDGSRPEFGVPAEIVMYGPRTDSAMDAPATFRVAHVADLPLREARWWFITAASNTFDGTALNAASPGTLPRYPDDRRTGIVEVTGCAGQTECVYQAAQAGAVVAQATLSDSRVLAARNVGSTEPSAAVIGITCVSESHSATTDETIRLTRGQRIECAVTVTGGALSSLTVTDWKFEESRTGGFTTSRVERNTLSIDPLTWNGPMLIPGRITVLGRFAGVPDEESASLTVDVGARDWSDRLPLGYPSQVLVRAATEDDRLDVPVRPTDVKHLAITNHFYRGDFGFVSSATPPVVTAATEGPNYLLNYFVAVPLMVDGIEVVMNEDALRARSDFWYAQRESAPTFSAGTPECTRDDVTSTLTRTRIYVHEGTQFDEGSHTQRFRAEYRRIVGPAMEQLILPEVEPEVAFKAAAYALYERLLTAARAADDPDKNAIDFRCRFTLLQSQQP